MLKYLKEFILLLFIFLLICPNSLYANYNNNDLGFSAIQTKYLDVDVNVEIPINVSSYNSDNSFVFKTFTFYNSRTQKVDFENYYLNSNGEKVHGEIEKDEYGNDVVVFNIDSINQSEYIFNITGKINAENKIVFNSEKYDLTTPITNENSSEDVEFYQQASEYIQSNDSAIISLAQSLKKSDNALEEIVNITNWIHTNIEYDMDYADVVVKSTGVLENRRGVCDELSILTAAILRARGFPVKYVVGIANTSVSWGPHAWLEVYVPTQGWIPIDPTYNEVGLVDSSHIVIAKVLDPLDCEDRLTTQNNIGISFGEKKTLTYIHSKKSFSDQGYDNYVNFSFDYPERLKSGSLFELKLNVKNTTINPIAILTNLLINDEFELVKPRSSKNIVYLDSFAQKDLIYYIILPETSRAKYYYFKMLSQFSQIEESVIVGPDEDLYYDAFFVLDPTIYFKDKKLNLEVDVINYTDSSKNLVFNYDFNEDTQINLDSDIFNIDSQSQDTFNKELDLNAGDLIFSIVGDYNYSRHISILPNNEVNINNPNLDNNGLYVDSNISDDSNDNLGYDSNIYSINKDPNKYKDVWADVNDFEVTNKSKTNVVFLTSFLFLFVILIVFYIFFKNR